MEESICQTCGKSFKYYRSTLRGKTGKFCSRKCIRLVANSGSFKNEGKYKSHICLYCKKIFHAYVNKGTKGKYCCKKCFQSVDHTACLGNYSKGIKGEKNPSWKGGITKESLRIRHSKEYILWRSAVFLRDDYTCQICGIRGKNIQADHIKPFSLFPQLRFAIDNGRTLCFSCHLKTDTWGGRVRKVVFV